MMTLDAREHDLERFAMNCEAFCPTVDGCYVQNGSPRVDIKIKVRSVEMKAFGFLI